jgi:NAD(P)-dependent dehydrogenase (short-subunit alcohol dehydrogenase family)
MNASVTDTEMTRNRELDGRVVIVTGGTRGIGRAIVLEAAARGARVAMCARQLGDEARSTCEEVERVHGKGRVRALAADVANEAEVDALFDATLDSFGRIDAVVNNAGINRDDLLVRTTAEAFDDVIATNLTGAFLIARRAVYEFLAQGEGGRIVSISSLSQRGATSQAAYAASKGGLGGLTRTLAKEYGARGIVSNIVAVGLVDTELSKKIPPEMRRMLVDTSPLRRAGSVREIAEVVLYLCSARAGFINGETLHATGGLTDVPL